jgi:hypothetical protein
MPFAEIRSLVSRGETAGGQQQLFSNGSWMANEGQDYGESDSNMDLQKCVGRKRNPHHDGRYHNFPRTKQQRSPRQ